MASQDDVRWARVKATAARWFARLDADQRRCSERDVGPGIAANAQAAAPLQRAVPEADPADVVEVAAVAIRRRA